MMTNGSALLLYIVGLIMFGVAIGHLPQFSAVHAFITIGGGLAVIGLVGMVLNYLDGKRG